MPKVIDVSENVGIVVSDDFAPSEYPVLYVDDERDYSESAKERIAESVKNLRMDCAETIKRADALLEASHSSEVPYRCVIVDVDMGSGSKLKGDEWLLRNYEKLAGANASIMTAKPDMISKQNRDRLKDLGVVTYVRAQEDQLYETIVADCKQYSSEYLNSVAWIVKQALNQRHFSSVQLSMLSELNRSAKRLLLAWLGSRKDSETKVMLVGSRELSFEDLAREVQKGTEIGNLFLELFEDDLADVLGITVKEKNP